MQNSILLKKYFACTVFVCLSFRLYFLSTAVSIVFFHFAAEASMKGEVSHFLDSPDA